MKRQHIIIAACAAAAGLLVGSCDMMLESSDLTPGYSVSVGAGVPSWDYNPWYGDWGDGGWGIGYTPVIGPPPVVGPLPSRPHAPGQPARPLYGPGFGPVIRPGGGIVNRPVTLPDNRPVLPDINGSNPGPVIRPSVPSRPSVPGQRPSTGQRPVQPR